MTRMTFRTDAGSRRALAAFVAAFALAGAMPAAAAEEARAAYVEKIAAIEANPAYGEYLSSQCSTCHATGSAGRIPPIRGLPAEDLIGALYDYSNGLRDNEVMKSVADALGDDEVAALAAYYEELEPQ